MNEHCCFCNFTEFDSFRRMDFSCRFSVEIETRISSLHRDRDRQRNLAQQINGGYYTTETIMAKIYSSALAHYNRKISFNLACTKAELLELAFNNLPAKKYLTDVAATEYQVEIVRLPIKHCILNPIELCWSQLKGYVRRNNTAFATGRYYQVVSRIHCDS